MRASEGAKNMTAGDGEGTSAANRAGARGSIIPGDSGRVIGSESARINIREIGHDAREALVSGHGKVHSRRFQWRVVDGGGEQVGVVHRAGAADLNRQEISSLFGVGVGAGDSETAGANLRSRAGSDVGRVNSPVTPVDQRRVISRADAGSAWGKVCYYAGKRHAFCRAYRRANHVVVFDGHDRFRDRAQT